MHWADKFAKEAISRKEKDVYLVESGITPSGIVHAGNFREIMTQDLVYRAFRDAGVEVTYQYVWDDFDRFRKVPKGIPDNFKEYIGMPVSKIPDPWGCHGSYSEHFITKIVEESADCGVEPNYIYMSKEYAACKFADKLKQALERSKTIIQHLNKFRDEDYNEEWMPVQVYCEKCGKDITTVSYLGGYEVSYVCPCGKENVFDIRKKGIIKLKWRIDWPMRWAYYDVDFESSGKDHMASGGSWDTGVLICKNVFDHEPPLGTMYEFIYAKGQKEKMSSSKGNVFTVSDLLEVYEPEIVRYLYTGKVSKALEVPFDLDVLNVYNYFDEADSMYFSNGEEIDPNIVRRYELSAISEPEKHPRPSFAFCASVTQIAKDASQATNILQRTGHLPKKLSDEDKKFVARRLSLAQNWVSKYAPDNVKITILKERPVMQLTAEQRSALNEVPSLMAESETPEELHAKFSVLCKKHSITPKELFQKSYELLLGRQRGPRLSSLLMSLDVDFVKERFHL